MTALAPLARDLESDLAALDRLAPLDLTSLSTLDVVELSAVAALVALRLLLLLRRGRRLLHPFLDLPLLGALIAVSGGSLSPLDPTLPLIYLAALLFLRRSEAGRSERWWLAAEVVVGLALLHGLVTRHDERRLEKSAARQREVIGRGIAALQSRHRRTLDATASLMNELQEPADVQRMLEGDAARAAGAAQIYERLRADLADTERRIAAFLAGLKPEIPVEELGARKVELSEALDASYDDYFGGRNEWRALVGGALANDPLATLDAMQETLRNIREELAADLDRVERALAVRDRLNAQMSDFLARSTWRRVAICGALALFALVALALRDRLSRAVRESEEQRARREIELSEQEKEHWIALTAGLTHGLGNDILAYDVYLRELVDASERARPPAAPRVLELLRFLRDSNRGRLGFLQFLDAFARQRQVAAGERAPLPTEEIELVPLIEQVRRNLAQVEIADLPRAGSDPAADRRIRVFRDLPVEVALADDSASRLRRGHRGVVEFFVYELLKNALRSCTGERALVARLQRRDGSLELALENDVQLDASDGACAKCGRAATLRKVRRRRDAPAVCERCFGLELQQLLDQSFAPGRGSGTGLGLFLIRYFVSTYWNGELRARVVDASVPLVSFELHLPDGPDGPAPLEGATPT